ncbi:MAG: hypothetical protein KJ856_09210 [Gammaproteobacteria bacterium]|nr:hypothetical protein [Gammaproteobacteria bacterium]MBU1479118.1 hypothetical protein [Gammaproteobacteria bacterium]MBU2003070.1 hypothetical protein [Gammaproteobacteria bacterium]MBU2134266.1 hypothetical protein [Gammaproteobacteria bacterium]MBU2187186.1 hypothetical protein [Gammaproteobacteria bacterium]
MNPSSILSFNYLLRFSLMAIVCMGIIFTLVDHWSPASRMDFLYHKKMRLFAQQKDELEAIVLGTSHSKGFHFPSLGMLGMNFFDGGGDIDEAEFKFNVIAAQARKLSIVFIPISPGSLQFSRRWIIEDESQHQYIVMKNTPISLWQYPALWGSMVTDYIGFFRLRVKLLDRIRSKLESLTGADHGEGISNLCYNKDSISEHLKLEDGIVGGYKRQLIKPACINQYADETVKSHMEHIRRSLSSESGIAERHLKALLSMAKTLEQRQGRLVLVIPPLTREYYQDPRIQALLPEHFALLSRLAAHPYIEVYDFHDFFYEQMADGSNDYFYDDDHLALPGAIEFSKALRETMGL